MVGYVVIGMLTASHSAMSYSLPPFSWETLPVAFHSSNTSGMYSEESLAVLAKFATVTVEKYQNMKHIVAPGRTWLDCQQGSQGDNLTLCGCCEEDEIVSVGRRIKALNPHTQVLAYFHSKIAYPIYKFGHELAKHPQWWLRNASGDVYRNTPGSPWFCVDHSQDAASQLWEQAALDMLATGSVDGVFIDGCAKTPGPLAPGVAEQYAANKVATMARLQQQAPGPLVCGSNGKLTPGVAATQIQNWGKGGQWSTREIPMLQRAVAVGAMFQAHGACPENLTDPHTVSNLASFLIAAGPYSYYMCGGWNGAVPTWFPVYDLPLGKPLSNATLEDGVYRREFSHGTIVTFDTVAEKGHIQWGSKTTLV